MNIKQHKAIQDILKIKEKDTTEVFNKFTPENKYQAYLKIVEQDKQLRAHLLEQKKRQEKIK